MPSTHCVIFTQADATGEIQVLAYRPYLWIESKTIRVYFDNEAPQDVKFQGKDLTADVVISLVNKHWNCDNVTDVNGKQIGGKVPHFVLMKQQQFSDIVAKFYGMKLSYQNICKAVLYVRPILFHTQAS